MNALTRWNPAREIEELASEMSAFFDRPLFERSLIERPFSRLLGQRASDIARTSAEEVAFYPAIDIEETDDAYFLKADLPRVNKDDVHVYVEEGALVIEGDRKEEKAVESAQYTRRERSWGHFYRSFRLPDGVDATRVEARLEDGALDVTLPKSKQAREKSHEIKVR